MECCRRARSRRHGVRRRTARTPCASGRPGWRAARHGAERTPRVELISGLPGDGALLDHGLTVDGGVTPTEAAPATPEDHRQDEPEGADDHEDHADRVDVDTAGI